MSAHYNEAHTDYADHSLVTFYQTENVEDVKFFTANFERGELISGYALSILELVRIFLGEEYWYFIEFPLQIACPKREGVYLDKSQWQYWVNSRVDIIVMNANPDHNCRKASLMVECQSPWHDLEDSKQRDRAKLNIINSTAIPLVYVRYADYPRVLRFWVENNRDEVFYNPFTQEGKAELKEFFTRSSM
ncbi:MAG: hypothetical protein NW224_24010 [Leptolyngbyaceae cyanobacterium bins.302]|nr:hypothetical protein [Leptolyngbyaceae cyanobacterium bins.302]